MMTSLLIILSIFCSAIWAQTPPDVYVSCPSGQVPCGGESPRRQCIPSRWLCDGDNDCGNNWDEDEEECAAVSCPSGQVSCEGESPRRRCIPTRWLCDGDNDCGNGWDENQEYCATASCPSGQVSCEGESPRRRCIPSRWLCDGDNDCGNGWDENQQDCANLIAALTCPPGRFQCPANRRRCISEHWLCDGDNDCGDNSDEDPSVCQASGIVSLRLCQRSMHQCVSPVFRPMSNMSQQQVYEKLVNTDLRQLCEPVLAAQQCAVQAADSQACQSALSPSDNPRATAFQQQLTAMNITVNHVCRQNVEVFNEHKECLLRELRGGIMRRIAQQCPRGSHAPNFCIPSSAMDCAENVVSEQCGAEIAGQLRTLGTKIMERFGCETHFEMKKKEMDPAFTGTKSMKKKKKTYSLLEEMEKALQSLF